MKRQLIYILLFILTVVSCEEIYNPVLDNVESLLVVEAILTSNQTINYINLSESKEFNNDNRVYESVTGAKVYFVDKNEVKTECEEDSPGKYMLNYQMQTGEQYYLRIEVKGETYKSAWQEVPEKPVMNSIYPEYDTRTITSGMANSTDDIITEKGIQVYADMNNNGKLNYYRFSARKIVQYINYYDSIVPIAGDTIVLPIYCWNSFYPTGVFNIAGPPEYSTIKNVKKHRLDFFETSYSKYFTDDTIFVGNSIFAGWIYFVYLYRTNEDTYNYYSDLNKQLDTKGKIFDPVYVQARGNISCTSSPDKVVLGNFEISSFSETRYFLYYFKTSEEIGAFRNIPYFYDIPEEGLFKNYPPDFWEVTSRSYPNE